VKSIEDAHSNEAVTGGSAVENHRTILDRERAGHVTEFGDSSSFVAVSPVMRQLRSDLERVAGVELPVLCVGESGTGKEAAARFIHRLSTRGNQAFVKVNCAALSAESLERELFGNEWQVSGDGVTSRQAQLCQSGTLFLDEITAMPASLQARMLSVLNDQEFLGRGGSEAFKITVRIIASAGVNLKHAIAEKQFREDLYHRLGAFVFEIPSLRARPQDIPVLFGRYVALHARTLGIPKRKLLTRVTQSCMAYDWPGNLTELENFAKAYLLFGEDAPSLERAEIWSELTGGSPSESSPDGGLTAPSPRRDGAGTELAAIAAALEQTHWNRRAAADLLHIKYKSLLLKMRQYRLGQ
jgi:DNA-binding NtrC family response regulator